MQPEGHFAPCKFDAFSLDPARGTLRGPGNAEHVLRPKAFALLCHLLDHPGRLLRRDELLDALWPDVIVTDDSLTQCVSDLRAALGDRAPYVLRTLPRRGYVFTAEVQRESPTPAAASVAASSSASHNLAALRRDTVFVHPVESTDSDPEGIRVAAALTEELIAAFARFGGLQVMAATDAGRPIDYRLHGALRAAGPQWHATVRLEDARGAALWAERLDWPEDGSHGVPEPVLQLLGSHVSRQIELASLRRAVSKPMEERTARELCLMGKDHHQRGTEAETLLAREFFDRAIAADPNYATAHAWQAYTVHRAITHGWGAPTGQAARDLALSLARRAVQLEPDSPLCLSRLAFALMLHQRWEGAVETARAALASGRPAHSASRSTCAEVLMHAGHAEEAEAVMREALLLDPLCPPPMRAVHGRALLLAGKVEEALPDLRWCAVRLPDYAPCLHSLVVALVEAGRLQEARETMQDVVRLRPDWVPCNHTGLWFFRREEDLARFKVAFGVAGLHSAA
ncbi:winged helix-turn-helix domain-containing protein [Muricoccus radiodurans]|uniref:winged helix-turn-helix domain-containing protein n=1 Tax=Muricoccus radiodurans TaxID=2231721 RepID=UPI003CF936AF